MLIQVLKQTYSTKYDFLDKKEVYDTEEKGISGEDLQRWLKKGIVREIIVHNSQKVNVQEEQNEEQKTEFEGLSELDIRKKGKEMGIASAHNMGIEKLKSKILEK